MPVIGKLRVRQFDTVFRFQEANYFQAQLIIFQELNQQQSLFWTIKKGQAKTTCELDQLIATIEKLRCQ